MQPLSLEMQSQLQPRKRLNPKPKPLNPKPQRGAAPFALRPESLQSKPQGQLCRICVYIYIMDVMYVHIYIDIEIDRKRERET